FAAEVREWEEGSAELLVKESTRSSIIIEEEEETGETAEAQTGQADAQTGKLLEVRAAKQTGRRTGLFVLAAVLALAALGVASYRWRRGEAGRAGAESAIRSIAVLPFKSLGADEGDAYMGVGMADTLITKLSAAGR